VQVPDESCLRPILALANHPTERRSVGFYVGLGRGEQGWVPKTWRASGALPGLGFPDSIVTTRAAKASHPRLSAFQGVAQARFAGVHRQSDASQPRVEALLTMGEDCTLRREDQAIISLGDDAGRRIHVGDGCFSPMEGHAGQQG